jgi:3-hydroxy-9,10-secoandrosta-1,3,5(10)-triene-9,17-dione monooxygenase reductase component
VSIHTTDPFAVPEEERSPVRRLRGRLAAAVTLWTALDRDGAPAGLTVSSMVVAEGEPARLLGLVDEESALWAAIGASRRFAVMPLRDEDRQLAEKFAGRLPAPGGPFRGYAWQETEFGPVLAGVAAWAGCRWADARPMGWSRLVEAVVDHVHLEARADLPALLHYRGRYRTLD